MRETQINKTNYPLINRHFKHSCKNQRQKIKSVLYAQSASQKQSTKITSKSNSVSQQKITSNKTTSINKINMPPMKRIIRDIFGNSSRTTEPPRTPFPSTCPVASSNFITPLTFDYLIWKVFSKFLIASLTSKDAVLKEVRDCILNNN